MREVLAGDLPALIVKGVAVTVLRGKSKPARHMIIFLQPAELLVVGDIAPHEIAANLIPGRTFRPECAAIEPLDRRVPELVLVEPLVQRDDIRVRVACRLRIRPKVARKGWPGHARQRGQARGNPEKGASIDCSSLWAATFCWALSNSGDSETAADGCKGTFSMQDSSLIV